MNIGLILAFKPDEVYINYEEQTRKVSNLLIGIYDKKLFKNNEYNALIGLEILNEGVKQNEYIANVKV